MGHLDCGESAGDALDREAEEELGIRDVRFERLYTCIIKTDVERELVFTFRCTWEGKITPHPDEIDDVRFHSSEEIESLLGTGYFPQNFEQEWRSYRRYIETESPPPLTGTCIPDRE